MRNIEEKREYGVFLPDVDIGIDAYFNIRRLGLTKAGSARKAVSNVIARDSRKVGLIMSALDREYGNAERFAVEVPEIEKDEGEFTQRELESLRPYAFAFEIAKSVGSNKVEKHHVDLAFQLLSS